MSMPLRLSVVICTKDRQVELRRCLASLAAQSRFPDELIVVDASRIPVRDVLEDFEREALGRCAIRFEHTEPGLPRQRNIGARASSGDVIVYLDDDVVLEPGYLGAIEEVYLRDREGRIGGVGGAQIPDPTPRLSPLRRLWDRVFLLESYGLGKLKRSGAPSYLFTPTTETEVEFLSGCNMSYRRCVLERLAFDERRSGYALGEDLEFSYRVSRQYRLVLTPRARLDHRHAPHGRPSVALGTEQAVVNRFLFARDHVIRGPLGWLLYSWAEIGRLGLHLTRHPWPRLVGAARGYRAVARMLFARKERDGRALVGALR